MVYLLRALGWLIFGSGALLFIVTGGFTAVREGNALTMVAGVMMPVGMFVTATCTMVHNWRVLRRRRAQEAAEEPASPASPGAPEKQYRVRPLKKPEAPSDAGQAE